jgi:hypothetical protein
VSIKRDAPLANKRLRSSCHPGFTDQLALKQRMPANPIHYASVADNGRR